MNTENPPSFKTGELLVREGLIHRDDIETALGIQEKRNAAVTLKKSRYLGMILCDLNLITPMDNYIVLHKHGKLVTLSSALVHQKKITRDRIQEVEAESLRTDMPLISLLIKKSLVSMPDMQQQLYDLFHIPFRSISDFVFNEKDRPILTQILNKETSEENGIIPMVIKDNTILFGMTAPENLLLIHHLNRRYPQYRFKSLFIPYSGFKWFHEIVYKAHPAFLSLAESEKEDEKKPVDLSLLFNFSAAVSHPEEDRKVIQTLYRQYEMLRQHLGHPQEENREDDFFDFIRESFARLSENYGSRTYDFSFQKKGDDVILQAKPKE